MSGANYQHRTVRADALGRRSLALEIGDMPVEMRAAVDAELPRVLGLLPPETSWLRVEYERRTSDNTIEVGTQHNYDTVWITILPGWLDQDAAGRRASLCHEIAHVWLARLAAVHSASLDQFVKDESSRKFIDKMLHDAEERTVDRLADLFVMFCETLPAVEVPK